MMGNEKLEKQLLWLMIIVLTAFFTSASVSVWASRNVAESEHEQAMGHARLEALNSLMLAFTEAETGQRGYLLTGNPAYLQPYYAAVSTANAQFMRFRDVFTGPDGLSAYNRLALLKEKKLSELAQTISLRAEHGLESAMLVVNSNTGESYMAEIREEIDLLARKEQERQVGLVKESTRNVAIFQTSVTLFLLLLALAVLSLVTLVRHDTQTKKQLLQRLSHEASHDQLTNLPNRNLYVEMLNYSIPFAQRYQRLLGIFFIDLDGFKQVNDQFGHDAGDMLLKEASRRMREAARESDVVARIGGDEFLVLATNLAKVEDIEAIARHMLACFEEPLLRHLQQVRVGASIGIAVYPRDGLRAAELIKAADIAMYEAKMQGKNGYAFHRRDEMKGGGAQRLASDQERPGA
ncbi:diguanylate cyclase domain-containing protein [Noviherbaspirillum galbum]|uniref:Diguanylate cyclase n=1 Tax=Noviherbaspirillum galbum TaxID=2709383 RepID=A0A6B3SJE4_9BURK|nr:diguanylate cyclase [Noviherbaspirillum galbum]NEX59475.1 diguanylate cyclase [Noviherbaspirillum galbum]